MSLAAKMVCLAVLSLLLIPAAYADSPVGDLNGDLRIDSRDLYLFTEQWLDPSGCSGNGCADFDSVDGVDMKDLAVLAERWNQKFVFINEVMAANSSTYEDVLELGEFPDWIELYNNSNDTISLGGCYLTDDNDDPTKWMIPQGISIAPGDYLFFVADDDPEQGYYHTNFKLSSDGDQVYLFAPDGVTLVDEVSFGQQYSDVSYGRYPDGDPNWQFMGTPTPKVTNSNGYAGQVADTEFSIDRGFYDHPLLVRIATDTDNAVIRYTTDGSTPMESYGSVYDPNNPIVVDTTTVIRAAAFKPGYKPSNVDTQTYIFLDDVIDQPSSPEGFPTSWGTVGSADYMMDPDVVYDPAYSTTIKDDLKAIPSVCISMDNEDFFGAEGVYSYPNQDYEKEASIEWIDPLTGKTHQDNAGLTSHGGVGINNRKHALRIIARSEYGASRIEFPLFEDSEIEKFDGLVLRSTWNYSWIGDSSYCGGLGNSAAQYMRDSFARDTVRDMQALSPFGRHVHLYINGLYWGLYILVERPDEGFAEEHLGGNEEDYDVLKHDNQGGMEVINGDKTAWNTMFALGDQDLSIEANYQALDEYLDMSAMVDYMLMIFLTGSRDSPVLLCNNSQPRNVYAIKSRLPNGKFVFIPWDCEWSLEHTDENRVSVYGYQNPHRLYTNLLANDEFRIFSADRIQEYFFNDGLLTPDKNIERYMNRIADIDRAIVGESARWGDLIRTAPYTRDIEWVTETNRLTGVYFPQRTDIVIQQLRDFSFLPQLDAPQFFVNGLPQHGGYLTPPDPVTIEIVSGDIYYTTDGSDPRLVGGTPNPAATMVVGEGSVTNYQFITEDANKSVLIPDSDIGTIWRGFPYWEPYDDSGWTDYSFISGKTGGIGYERSSSGLLYHDYISYDVESDMYGNLASCYIRIEFEINAQDLAGINELTLKVRCDDGFVAFINGDEAASINKPDPFNWNSSCANRLDNIEFATININSSIADLHAGTNILAIHAMNQSTTSSDFLFSVELDGKAIDNSASDIMITDTTQIKARCFDGSEWSALTDATFAVGPVAENLRISEIMYHPQDTNNIEDPNEEFIELVNTGASAININQVKFTNGIDFTFGDIDLAAGQRVVAVRNIAAFEAQYGTSLNVAGQYDGSLDNSGEWITLEDAAGTIIHDFKFKDGWRDNTDGDGYSLTVINPSNTDPNTWAEKDGWRPSAHINGSPSYGDDGIIPNPGDLMINEVMAHTDTSPQDWVELYNTTGTAINITGFYLSDNKDDRTKYQIPSMSVPANGYAVLTQDAHFGGSFALSENGDEVYLTSPTDANTNLTGYRQGESFGASANTVSFGRYQKSTGTYNFAPMSSPTYGAANAYPAVGPVIITEIMYHPEKFTGDWDAEYIELHNITGSAVQLYDANAPWAITDGVNFEFPTSTSIPAYGTILLVKDTDAFEDEFGPAPGGVQVFEWTSGSLSNGGEQLQLSKPGDLDESSVRQYIRIDRVTYSDGSNDEDYEPAGDPWPDTPDGLGKSLEKMFLTSYSNDPNAWHAADPTPGVAGSGWDILAYDDFESGWGNYTDGGGDAAIDTAGVYAHQGTNSANIQDNSGDASAFWLTTGININTPGYTELQINFWFQAINMDAGESFNVQFYNGSTWQTVATYVADTDFVNSQFYNEQVTILESSHTFPSNMKIKFECIGSANTDDIYIDEVVISAN